MLFRSLVPGVGALQRDQFFRHREHGLGRYPCRRGVVHTAGPIAMSLRKQNLLLRAIRYESGVYNTDITENSNIAQSYRAINESIRENNDYLYKDPNNPFAIPEIVMPQGGKRTKQVTTFNGNNLRATLNYNDSFTRSRLIFSRTAP